MGLGHTLLARSVHKINFHSLALPIRRRVSDFYLAPLTTSSTVWWPRAAPLCTLSSRAWLPLIRCTNTACNSTRWVRARTRVAFVAAATTSATPPLYRSISQPLRRFHTVKSLFVMRLENSVKHDVLEERLRILIDDVTLSMYINICRGLVR